MNKELNMEDFFRIWEKELETGRLLAQLESGTKIIHFKSKYLNGQKSPFSSKPANQNRTELSETIKMFEIINSEY